VLLWIVIVTTLALFWRVDRIAGVLFAPYLLWVSFALCLNLSV
jgi:translocator protein